MALAFNNGSHARNRAIDCVHLRTTRRTRCVCFMHTAAAAAKSRSAQGRQGDLMQRLFARVAAHFFSSAALQSDTTIPVPTEPGAPWGQRTAHGLARFLERCESSPHLLGEEKAQDALVITFLTAFSMIGWLMLTQGYEQWRQARAIELWPTTVGTVLAVDMQAADGGGG